jgi:predicted lipoprotein with Yx(FWY)xxD motif
MLLAAGRWLVRHFASSMKSILIWLALAGTSLPSFAADAQGASVRDGVLVDSKGMSLYIFKEDGRLQSSCYGNCAKVWPPHLATPGARPAGDYAPFLRKDGSTQWAWKGQPLYRYMGDEQPGDTEGEGSAGTWYLVRVGP